MRFDVRANLQKVPTGTGAVHYMSLHSAVGMNYCTVPIPNIDVYRQDLEALFEIAGRPSEKRQRRVTSCCRAGQEPRREKMLLKSV